MQLPPSSASSSLEYFGAVVVPVAAGSIAIALSLVWWWVTTRYKSWKKNFAHRHSRRSKHSPSNKNTPTTVPTHNQQSKSPSDRQDQARELKRRTASLTPRFGRSPLSSSSSQVPSSNGNAPGSLRQSVVASTMSIDHVYMDFFQFLWFQTLTIPGMAWATLSGVISIRLRDFLFRRGFTGVKRPHDEAQTAARLLLETAIAIHYEGRSPDDANIGIFRFPQFPIVQSDGTFVVAQDGGFCVYVDLKETKVVEAWLDEDKLTISQCFTLVGWADFAIGHQQLHGFTNWALNHDTEQRLHNPDLAWQSVATAGYNYFGYTVYGRHDKYFRMFGHLSPQNATSKYKQAVTFAERQGVVEHSRVVELVKHSRVVRFVVALRLCFFREFAKYKDRFFPGCDGEALFVSTVLHSMDHTSFANILKDTLWFDVDCPKFGLMAEHGRLASLFMADFSLFTFEKKMKDSSNPFYQAVYLHAARIDRELADCLEVCVFR